MYTAVYRGCVHLLPQVQVLALASVSVSVRSLMRSAFPDLGDGEEMHPSGRLRRTVVLVMRVYARTRSPGDNLSKTTFFT